MEEEEAMTLKLIMEGGPLAGETLEFKPGRKVQIGRTVRGNTVSIKDAGISTHHFSIQFTDHSDEDNKTKSKKPGKWVITDLNSSNGTILNSEMIPPMVPTDLGDGDIVKIGEVTSIQVKVGEIVSDYAKNQVRRNPRRRGTVNTVGGVVRDQRRRGGAKANLDSIDENSELRLEFVGELGKTLEENKKRRGLPRKARVFENEVQQSEIKVEILEEMENVVPNEAKRGRQVKTRSSNNKIRVDEVENNGDMDQVAPTEAKSGCQVSSCRSGSSKVENLGSGLMIGGLPENEMQESEIGVAMEGKVDNVMVEVKLEKRVSTRRTRSSKKQEAMNLNVDGSHCREFTNLVPTEGKKTGRGRRGKKNLQDEKIVSMENAVSNEKEVVEESNKGLVEECSMGPDKGKEAKHGLSNELLGVHVDVLEDEGDGELNLGEVGCERLATAPSMKGSSLGGKEVPNLETMTLGEWFDYLEVYLPKQIHVETEELILGMKQRAEQFHEFILHQKNGKGKLPMG
ncbi:unnamed protein product [Ilex paraguariensis]|uniref:FHA domain-containing protein n=1 Tax=Ilex paraguariensis TaxID=185542 RepID=A0ABC8T7R0_9AQUA